MGFRRADRGNMPGEPGTYLLLLRLEQGSRVKVGALGNFYFCPGYYIYVGSAMGGLSRRITRYFTPGRKTRWHIDYLRTEAGLVNVFTLAGKSRRECAVASFLSRKLPVPVKNFGSSDCHCPSHLFYCSADEEFQLVLKKLNRVIC